MVKVFRATEGLPSLPQVLVRILDALQGGEADFQELAGVLLHDSAMSARVIAVANSSFYSRGGPCNSVERALLSLGLDTVKTLILTASIKQLFGQFNQGHRAYLKQVWRHTLITASLAQVLATLTRYPRPEEAYLCGLLVDVGQLALLSAEEARYWPMLQAVQDSPELLKAEREAFGQSHCDLAGEYMEAWGLGSFMADAVRYHLEPVSRVLDAHHLVKLVNLAHVLGRQDELSDAAIATADTLFGLNEGLTRELRGRIADDVSRLAGSLEIDIDTTDDADRERAADRALGQRVSDLGQLSQLSGALGQVEGAVHKRTAVERALFITLGVARSVLFLCDPQGQSVSAWVEEAQAPAFTLPLVQGRSLVTDVLLNRTHQQREASALESLPVVDRQLFTLCQAEVLWLLPLVHEDMPVGVLVLGLSRRQRDELTQRTPFVQALSREIAAVLGRTDTDS
ncbi:MAG TPA: HDOD domain-containing protein, partial [Thioalkalivibrio sp.]|nr:HDOD domain-containing protein [Thioalkalivibrio sp.]